MCQRTDVRVFEAKGSREIAEGDAIEVKAQGLSEIEPASNNTTNIDKHDKQLLMTSSLDNLSIQHKESCQRPAFTGHATYTNIHRDSYECI
jgi:hypothetical protein